MRTMSTIRRVSTKMGSHSCSSCPTSSHTALIAVRQFQAGVQAVGVSGVRLLVLRSLRVNGPVLAFFGFVS